MNELRLKYKLADLLIVTKISRSTYYYWIKVLQHPDKYEDIKEAIKSVYHTNKGRYGYRRITLELRNRGYIINHKTVLKLMQRMGLKSIVRVKKYQSYTGSAGKVAPNILNRDFTADRPNQKWATDITQFSIHGQKVYLSTIIDLFNREIVAYEIDTHMHYRIVKNTLMKALPRLKDNHNLILHSDQGWHYTIEAYIQKLKKNNITQSMSRRGNCLDNAVMENFFGHLKSELVRLQKFDSIYHFIDELHNYIYYYNNDRIKQKLGGMSPVEYRMLYSTA